MSKKRVVEREMPGEESKEHYDEKERQFKIASAHVAETIRRTFDKVNDSGKRQEFVTGSKRDTREGKGRFDLIPTYPLRRLARHYQNGAEKYGDKNWERGQPLSRYLDSCMRHLIGVLEGLTDEDHASACAWNMFSYIATCQWIEEGKLPAELDDLGHTSKGTKVCG